MREVYEEAGRAAGTPLATLDEAFKGFDDIVLYDKDAAGWHPFDLYWPKADGPPSNPGGGSLPTFWDIAPRVTRWALYHWRTLRGDRRELPLAGTQSGFTPPFFHDLASVLGAERGCRRRPAAELPAAAADQVPSRVRAARRTCSSSRTHCCPRPRAGHRARPPADGLPRLAVGARRRGSC